MWERIAVSGVLVAGAIALFLVLTALLFFLERSEKESKQKKQPQALRVIRYEKKNKAA